MLNIEERDGFCGNTRGGCSSRQVDSAFFLLGFWFSHQIFKRRKISCSVGADRSA